MVISMGDCASCGGVFNNYAVMQGWMRCTGGCLRGRLPAAPRSAHPWVLTLYEKVRGIKFADEN